MGTFAGSLAFTVLLQIWGKTELWTELNDLGNLADKP